MGGSMSKELKKDKLYLLEVDFPAEREDGSINLWRIILVGYVIGKEEEFFYGSTFDKNENGEYRGADTMHLSVTEFNDWVKSIKEIA